MLNHGGGTQGTQPDGGAVPAYMAPMDSGASTDSGNGDIDSGVTTKYMAPFDSGPIPPYMVQQVDAGEQPTDAGEIAIYLAVVPE